MNLEVATTLVAPNPLLPFLLVAITPAMVALSGSVATFRDWYAVQSADAVPGWKEAEKRRTEFGAILALLAILLIPLSIRGLAQELLSQLSPGTDPIWFLTWTWVGVLTGAIMIWSWRLVRFRAARLATRLGKGTLPTALLIWIAASAGFNLAFIQWGAEPMLVALLRWTFVNARG